MGILDRIKKNKDADQEWTKKRVDYWKKEYASFSDEELKEKLDILDRKALLESWESPFKWNFWFGGLAGKRTADLDTEIQRIVIKELLSKTAVKEVVETLEKSTEPQELACPRCGAPLKTDPVDNIVECGYCKMKVRVQ